MRRLTFIALSAGLSLATAGAAQACYYNMPAKDRIRRTTYDAVLLARVDQALYTDGLDQDQGDRNRPWSAQVTATSAVVGAPDQTAFEIGRTAQPTACDDGQPIAKVGDTWVLYLMRRRDGPGYQVSQSYPLAFARQYDARLLETTP
ncbi:hypothetical protein DMC25_20385 [Caulobacter sp. D4A]|uniref:hypothetical protein n=1 Tax=unclassified Caulobacter TaxID=2648921 RepID=UPI000D732C5B|nr:MULTISPECIES: hypothetical protein [unclassified Caulobacter]PXA81799.1 hypothetical protein DMC25_20385 [Caulobacter sp. D4A]PXA89038.1 hypothetical protein DMC18_17965 [Caulobacter sp. D5]